MKKYVKLWSAFGVVTLASFAVLGYYGREIYREAPPVPAQVVSTSGQVLFTGEDIKDGQNIWQSMGGHNLGSIWGHGSYVAPDWTADFLHREAVFILNQWSKKDFGSEYEKLNPEQQAALKARTQKVLRENTYDASTDRLILSDVYRQAYEEVSRHYSSLFSDDPNLSSLRKAYAIPANTLKDPEKLKKLNEFFFWATWATVTNRPRQDVSYTNNWPPEDLVGNRPAGSLILWTGFSVIVLLAGVGLLVYFHASNRDEETASESLPQRDPLLGLTPTPSMKATLKYFWVVAALIIVQILLGVVTAHYGVEGSGFYGFPLDQYLPYAVTRTWHLQLAIFWIATSWLATGLYIASAVSGYEPRFQRAGVNFLFFALLIIVVGSLAGEWLGVMQRLGLTANFWFGHQGYEYVELGRFWQIFLLVGLFLWFGLMVRAILPAFKTQKESRHLLTVFTISSAAIALFYSAGIMYGQRSNLAIAEYWRWWVVHLWVEGFFEVFATVAIAFLFTRMGLIREKTATLSVLFSTIVFLSGGILGTFHHLYFTGTPIGVMALGATFSALEVVPLVLMGFEGYHNLTLSRSTPWVRAYQWPIYFFIAVTFWNLVGAGIFGFLINPPIALYYMQGLNTTPVHGHTALFGVYGNLGIGLMLFCLKGLAARNAWKDGVIGFAFWAINIGLGVMVLISVLPVGFLQTLASVEHGMWYARSAEFMQTPIMEKLRWLRVIGDTVFAMGVVALAVFIAGLKIGFSLDRKSKLDQELPVTGLEQKV